MTNELIEIETLENVIIALREGASDEKRTAIDTLERMINRKREIVEEFEAYFNV